MSRILPIFMAVLFGLGMLRGLSHRPLWDPDEGRNAEVVREEIVEGHWLIPTFNGEPRLQKPPLYYWVTGGLCAYGGLREYTLRLTSLLSAMATLVFTFYLASLVVSVQAAAMGTLILASSIFFMLYSNIVIFDMFLTMLCTATVLFFWRFQMGGGTFFLVLAYLSTAMAFLTKGPVGCLPMAFIALYRLFRTGPPFWRTLIWGVPLVCLISLPWFFVAAAHHPEGIVQFFLKENLQRFLQGYGGHREGWYYYLVVLALGAFPWILSVFRLPFVEDAPKGWGFLALWFLGTIIFFSLSQSKSPHYVLPAFVPLSIMLGHLWTVATPREAPLGLGVLLLLAPLGLTLWGALPVPEAILATLPAAGIMLVLSGGAGSKEGSFMLTALVLFSVWVGGMEAIKPLNHLQSQKELAALVSTGSVETIYFHKTLSPSLLYYSGARGKMVEDPEHAVERPLVLDLKRYLKHPYWWSEDAVVWGKKVVIFNDEEEEKTIARKAEEPCPCQS